MIFGFFPYSEGGLDWDVLSYVNVLFDDLLDWLYIIVVCEHQVNGTCAIMTDICNICGIVYER